MVRTPSLDRMSEWWNMRVIVGQEVRFGISPESGGWMCYVI